MLDGVVYLQVAWVAVKDNSRYIEDKGLFINEVRFQEHMTGHCWYYLKEGESKW